MSGSQIGISSIPKWQIAIALGATGAIGLGYWYLRQSSVRNKKPTLESASKGTISIDDSNQDSQSLTPIEQSERAKAEGNNYFKRGKYDEAINHYNKAIELCPDEKKTELAVYYQNRAAAYEQLKKWSSVISDCSKSLELNPKYEKALYRRAKAYEATKDYQNCLDDVTAVCLLQGFKNGSALHLADRTLRELGKQHAQEAYKNRKPKLASKQFIKTYFMSFSEDPVLKILLDTSELIPDENVTGFLRAKMEYATQNYDAIIDACTEEIEQGEGAKYLYPALLLRATFRLLSGCQLEAVKDLDVIIDAKQVDPLIQLNALIKRASHKMQIEDSDSCLKDFEQAAQLGPNISDVYLHRGQVYLLLDKTEEARRDFNKAVELRPDFAIAVVQKCYADYRYALSTQNVDLLMESLKKFREATEKFPTCTEAFILFAQTLTERQQYEQADALYKKASELDPSNASIHVHQGLLYLQWEAAVEKAVTCMRKAIEVDDKCEFAYETLGTVEVQRGNLLLAIDLFDKAINLARTEMEMVHLFSLKDAAISQLKITQKMELDPQLLGKS